MSQNTQSYFIAVPGDTKGVGMHGFGTSEQEAIYNAYEQSGTREPTIEFEDNKWLVDDGLTDPVEFSDESEARDYAAKKSFVAQECTQRLHDYIEAHGAPDRWDENDEGLQDLELDTSLVEEIVEDVMSSVDENVINNDSDYDWNAQDALGTYSEGEDYAEELAENPRLEEAVIAELTKRLAKAQAERLQETSEA